MESARFLAAAFSASALFIAVSSTSAVAEKVGTTVAAADTVNEIGGGANRRITASSEIFQDDRLKSNASGNAQIELIDGTKIVVGPSADIRIDDFVFAGNKTLKQLTVSATRGAFRFISGRSAHSAYKVVTPTGTIGVRGTAFDVTISGGTYIALLSGALRVCDRKGVCREVNDPCQFIFVGNQGIAPLKRLDRQLASVDARKMFPLIANQKPLRPQFRRLARGCTTVEQSPSVTQLAAVPSFVPPVVPVVNPPVVNPPVFNPPSNTPPSNNPPGNNPPSNNPPGNNPPGNDPPSAAGGNPGNDKGVGNAGENPGRGGFGDTVNGKSDTAGNNSQGNNGNGGNKGNNGNNGNVGVASAAGNGRGKSAEAPGHNR